LDEGREEDIMNDERFCVYLYRDPLSQEIFYIGEGTVSRALNLDNHTNIKTSKIIKEIRDKNKEPIIEFLREGLDKETAQLYEGVAIDVIGLNNLTNEKSGKGSNRRNPYLAGITREELNTHIDPDEALITERVILIRINQLYRGGMDADSLYDATRGVWVIGPRRERVEYAFSVFKGIVKEVYKIKKWYPAGIKATYYKTRPECNEMWTYDPQRWEFEGEIANDIREKYLKKSVKRYLTDGSQNPIKYVNC
jgi:hypothetical protein